MSRFTPRTKKYWQLAAQVKREEPTCALCGQEIEAWRKNPDPLAYQCDHIIPASVRPDLSETRTNLRATHAKCNRARDRGQRSNTKNATNIYINIEDI